MDLQRRERAYAAGCRDGFSRGWQEGYVAGCQEQGARISAFATTAAKPENIVAPLPPLPVESPYRAAPPSRAKRDVPASSILDALEGLERELALAEESKAMLTELNRAHVTAALDSAEIITSLESSLAEARKGARTKGTVEVCERSAVSGCIDYPGRHERSMVSCPVFACPIKRAQHPTAPQETAEPDDLDKPHKADKGHRNGSCNRQACQDPPANYFNRGSGRWYCESCAVDLNFHNRDFHHRSDPDPMCIPESAYDADPAARFPW